MEWKRKYVTQSQLLDIVLIMYSTSAVRLNSRRLIILLLCMYLVYTSIGYIARKCGFQKHFYNIVPATLFHYVEVVTFFGLTALHRVEIMHSRADSCLLLHLFCTKVVFASIWICIGLFGLRIGWNWIKILLLLLCAYYNGWQPTVYSANDSWENGFSFTIWISWFQNDISEIQ